MRRLVAVLLAGGLAASLGAPGLAGAGERSKDDDKITAQRDSDGCRSACPRDRSEDDYRYRRDRRQPYGYYRDSYERDRYQGDPGYDRRARKRQQECDDSYYYDPSFYDRYCRGGYHRGYR
jgi:hypothetical protein